MFKLILSFITINNKSINTLNNFVKSINVITITNMIYGLMVPMACIICYR